MAERIETFRELRVYQTALEAAMDIFHLSKQFPADERFSLTDQIRRSSRSVCANIAEGWRKRRYEAAFVAKLSDAESEGAETQVWLDVALRCGYVSSETHGRLNDKYEHVVSQLVKMIDCPEKWVIRP